MPVREVALYSKGPEGHSCHKQVSFHISPSPRQLGGKPPVQKTQLDYPAWVCTDGAHGKPEVLGIIPNTEAGPAQSNQLREKCYDLSNNWLLHNHQNQSLKSKINIHLK